MNELLGYSKYNYLICFPQEALLGDSALYGTSNRVPQIEWLTSLGGCCITENEEDNGLTSGELFFNYFEIKSKQSREISDEETSILASIHKFYATIKEKIASTNNISFEKAQIMFTLPMGYKEDEYQEILQTFFLQVGWITNKDDKSKLLVVPFIEALVRCLQDPLMSEERKIQLERERKYLLLSRMVPKEDSETESYTATYFQMRCAKELILVSKKLASSSFLLTPTIIGQKTICLPRLDSLILAATKSALAQFLARAMNGCAIQDMELSKMAGDITASLAGCLSFQDLLGQTMDTFVRSQYFEEWKHQSLGVLRMDQFVMNVFHDTSIQQYTKQVCDFLQENLDDYCCIVGSPDGIHNIIMHAQDQFGDRYQCFIQEALFQTNIAAKHDIRFTGTLSEHTLATSGALKPLKMIQVANAILPPIIVDDDKENQPDDDIAALIDSPEKNNVLIPINSFYIQANISKGQVDFILNKVVKVRKPDNSIELFTVQKKTVAVDDIVDMTSDSLWSHFQLLESQGQLAPLINYCQEHDGTALSLDHYKCFNSNLKDLIQDWFQNKCVLTADDLDMYHSVSSAENCICALKITQRTLLELGLKPAVANLAATITSIIYSNDNFGLYQITALIVNGDMRSFSNTYYSDFVKLCLEEEIRKCPQVQQRRPLLFSNQKTDTSLAQYLCTGDYIPISGTTYTIEFELSSSKRSSIACCLCNNDSNLYETLSGEYSELSGKRFFSCEHTILDRGEELPLEGINKTFLLRGNEGSLFIKCFASHGDKNRTLVRRQIISFHPQDHNPHFTVNISHQHHSSTVKVTSSYISCSSQPEQGGIRVYLESFKSITERIMLKKRRE